MPYKDPARQRAYQLRYNTKRRKEWLAANGPCARCGSWENLEVDHINPETKVSHRIWSWSEQRRLSELAKCRVLCSDCHKKKSSKEKAQGENVGTAKLTQNEAEQIRALYATGNYTMHELGCMYGIHKANVSRLVRGITYIPR